MALIRIEPKKDPASDLYYVEIFHPARIRAAVRDHRAALQNGRRRGERHHRHYRDPRQQPAEGRVGWFVKSICRQRLASPLPLAGEVDALSSAIARKSAAGGGRRTHPPARLPGAPTPTLPRTRESAAIVAAFDHPPLQT
jgi:hypothetical protein